MNKKVLVASALIAIGVTISGGYTASAATTITKVYDGDTITLSTGEKVRLLQIDTPELSPADCYGKEARAALVILLSTPGQLSLKTDSKLDKVDRYSRLLRYLFIGKTNINLNVIYSSLFNLGADGSGGSGGGIAVNTDGGEPVWLGAVIACLVVGVAGIVGMATFYRRKLSKHQESVM